MNEIKEYLSSVKKRLEIILDLATYLPAKTPFFWGDEVITRLSDQDRETFKSYLSAARQNQENVTECKKTIGKRLDYCIKQAASVEPPADETPLLMVYGLFDETLRLSALAMQSVALSDRIARLLEKYSDEEKTAAARQYQDEAVKALLNAIHEEHAATRGAFFTLQETIEDQHRHAGELWATVPECVRIVEEMAKDERADGKDIDLPPIHNTFKKKVSAWLSEHGKRQIGTPKKPYSPLADIADAIESVYPEFIAATIYRQIEKAGKPADDIKKPKHEKKRT